MRVLDSLYDQWVERGAAVARAQFPVFRHRVRTDRRWLPLRNASRWWRGSCWGRRYRGRRITPLAVLFKQAVLSKYQALHGEPPAVVHGHGFSGSGYELARFLALADVGFPHSRGRIHGLALWLPSRTDPLVRRRARDAAHAVRRLTGSVVDVAVAPREDEDRHPVAAIPARWTRPSRRLGDRLSGAPERRGPPRSGPRRGMRSSPRAVRTTIR